MKEARAKHYTTMQTEEGWYAYDEQDNRLVGRSWDTQFEAELEATRLNRQRDVAGEVVNAVTSERRSQDARYGTRKRASGEHLAILMKKVGDAAAALLDPDSSPRERNLEQELIEVAAVTHRWLEDLKRSRT